ncbi:MAG TPA: DUF1993 domain-containing protein [Caulobacteraceae bacterium]|nr:DUF1993 domain-containing protein [Caulobacteraceae bacterium]
MTTNLFTFVALYRRIVRSTAHVLAKGAAHAATISVSSHEMLDWRLIDDMQPLRFQVAVVCNFSKQWTARVAGISVPDDVAIEADVAGFQASLADAERFLDALTPEQFAGRGEVPLTVTIGNGMQPTLPAERWLTVFATTNLYFHLSTAYDILRSRGAPLGKVDLFTDGL